MHLKKEHLKYFLGYFRITFFGSAPQEARIVDKMKIKTNFFMVLFRF